MLTQGVSPGDSVSVRGMRRPSRSTLARGLLVWGGLAVSAFFAYLAVRDVRLGGMWKALAHSNYWWLVPSLAVLAVCVALRALRWQFLFSPATRPRFVPTVTAL